MLSELLLNLYSLDFPRDPPESREYLEQGHVIRSLTLNNKLNSMAIA